MDSSLDSLPPLRLSGGDPPEHDRLARDPTPIPVEVPRGRRTRATRLRAVKADIAENAFRPTFSIGEVAARHGVSSRYIRRLFEGTGMTFTEYTLEQRLLMVRQVLSDPRNGQRAIGAIALDAGFGDLSYFNRAFRKRFGATPSEIRAAAREKPEE